MGFDILEMRRTCAIVRNSFEDNLPNKKNIYIKQKLDEAPNKIIDRLKKRT